jgi:signal peptidase I
MKKNKIIALYIVSLVVAAIAFARPYPVSGDCMEPAIMDGHLYFLNKITPYLRQYQIGDIVAFTHEGKAWVSRIVASEDQTIQITEGSIVINGTALDDMGIHRNWSGWNHGIHAIDKPIKIPTNHVFVLSDNLPAKHDDSRVFGPIPNSSILGLIW